jgi:predicted metal-binding membrane protein
MAVLLVTGVMNLAVMAILAIAIAVERITSFPQRTARITGVLLILPGAFMIAGVLRA